MPAEESHEQYELRPMDQHRAHPTPRRHVTKKILSHGLLLWTTLLLAVASYILTVLYAWHPEIVSRVEIFGGSPAKALRVLAILSMIANWLLAASMSQSIDLTRGMLIARRIGLCFMHNLALQPGTGLDGHAEIIFRRHHHGFQPRAWSIFKILSITIIPILGIVILRDVEVIPVFYQKTSKPVSRGFGIGPFNSSLAPLLQPLTDAVFGTRFKDFLSDTDLVVDVSSASDRKGCVASHQNDTDNTCRSKYFVPGGIEQFAPRLLVDVEFAGETDIQPVLAKGLQGYFFEFKSSDSVVFDQRTDCVRHGYPIGAYQLCLKDVGLHQIASFLTPCPKHLAANFNCLNNETWPLDNGWGTTLSTYSRPADVAYNGLNGTILSYQFPNASLAAVNINAPELLQVFSTLFSLSDTNSTYGSKLAQLGIGSKRPVVPLTIWQYFQGLAELSKIDSRANRRAMIGLQSLLAIPIYHCQAKDFAELRRLLLEQLNNSAISETLGLDIVGLFPVVEADTDIYPAFVRYSLRVGRGSLLAYIVLAGSTLSLCLLANLMGSLTNVGLRSRRMGAFPLLTHLCECETVYQSGRRVLQEDYLNLSDGEKLSSTADMRVKLAARHHEDCVLGGNKIVPGHLASESGDKSTKGGLVQGSKS